IVGVQFTMSEPRLYGKTQVNYAAVYRVVNAGLRDMLAAGGLWRPVPDSDWKLWAGSVQTLLGPRGAAGLVFAPNDDQVVDLCAPVQIRPPQLIEQELTGGQLVRPGGQLDTTTFPPPTPQSSWLQYECDIEVEADAGTLPVRPLPEAKEIRKEVATPRPRPGMWLAGNFFPDDAWVDVMKQKGGAGAQAIESVAGAAAVANIVAEAGQLGTSAVRNAVQIRARPLVYV